MTWLTDKAQLVHLIIPWKAKAYFPEDTEMAEKQWKDSWEKVFILSAEDRLQSNSICFQLQVFDKRKKE